MRLEVAEDLVGENCAIQGLVDIKAFRYPELL
jgi:hypothetical protein